jgi:beta-galactosidase
VRSSFQLPVLRDDIKVTLFTKSIAEGQSIYVNGELIAANIRRNTSNQEFVLDHRMLKSGINIYAVVGIPFVKTQRWEELNVDPGVVQVRIPAEIWKRKTFNGLAQIIVQSAREPGEISLTAKSPGLKSDTIKIIAQPANLRPALLSK